MKISKLIYAAAVGVVLASCQSVETPMFSDKDAFVAFEKEKINVTKNIGREVRIPVTLVSISGFDATVEFTIDTVAYNNTGKGAKEGVNYVVKNETNTLTFKKGENMTDYIVIEPINFSEDVDVSFDIKLVSLKGDCSMGAYNTMAVTIGDGLAGTYKASAPSPFQGEENVVYTWNCEVRKDNSNKNIIWFSQLTPSVSGAVYNEIQAEMNEDRTSAIIGAGEIGSFEAQGTEYTLHLEFGLTTSAPTSAAAQIIPGKITISSTMYVNAYNGSTRVGTLTGARGVTLTKVEDY